MSDDFLSRWSRRKRGAEAVEDAAPEPEPVEEPPAEETDEDVLARLGLKHPDEMEPGDDFATFLRSAVPRHLKTLAYRRLWRSNPTLACLDGLNDYDGDFTGTGAPAGGVRTAYQVGRGLLGRIVEVAENRGTEVPADDPEADAEPEQVEEEDSRAAVEPEIVQSAESVPEIDTPGPARRRMAFRPRG